VGRTDSRRIALGLAALALVSAAILNVGIYQSERTALAERRWEQLARGTDTKRNEVRERIWHLQRQSGYAAANPALVRWAERGARGAWSAAEKRELQLELERTVRALELHHVDLIGPSGERLAASHDAPGTVSDAEQDLVLKALASGGNRVALFHGKADAARLIAIASVVPTPGGSARKPVLVSVGLADEALAPLLATDWVMPGVAGHAYLVAQEGGEISLLTPPQRGAPSPGSIPAGDPQARAAALAASGVESNVEMKGRDGQIVWATTRFLPELGWGLVGEVPRSALIGDLRTTVIRLFLLDWALVLCVCLLAWVWRRQYVTGLARHEVKLVNRHAARIQAVLDTAFDAIITFDRDGRVRTVNRAAEEMLGRKSAELDGQPLHRFLRWGGSGPRGGQHPLPTPGVVCLAEVRRAGGDTFPAEFSLGQAGEGDELLYTAIIRDVSERVEAERRIRAFAEGLETSNRRLEEVNAQLQEASRLKSEFLANTSHELRTPLNGMIGFLQLVLDGLCESPEEEREFLRQGLQCSRHLLGLINDVLDIAKIEAGKLNVEAERIHVADLFADVETVTHVQAKQGGIALRFEPPAEDVFVRCDFAKTKQVLINLIGNSLKFTPKGSITVKASAHPDLGHLMFEVVDTGVGIPADRQKVIFEKFIQADGSTTRKYGGTGLGLAISRSLVELMGGIIGVHSEGEGRGTRMYFSLPIWDDSAASLEAEGEAGDRIEGPANGSLVLVVEDDPVFRRFLTAVLHQHGFRTVISAHAEGAWMLARRLQPSIVVLDYALSCAEGAMLRTGWDLAERMTGDAETRHIPLIFVTGFDLELREKLKSTAFSRRPEHLMKPVDGSVLVAKIEELVGNIRTATCGC
jgi:PAS domain S-box-containing protein